MALFKLILKSVLVLIIFILVGCSVDEKTDLNEFIGYVGSIESGNEPRILVIPIAGEEDLLSLSEEEIIELAIQNEGTYFLINEENLELLEKGVKVKVFYDSSLGAEDSLPQIKQSEKVEVLKE